MATSYRRVGLLLALAFALAPLSALQSGVTKTAAFRGKVVTLSSLLAQAGVKADSDVDPFWRALQTDDGKVYPLVKDAGARMFFKDASLLNRPMRLTGRLVTGVPMLQVVLVQSYQKDRLHDVYYWCDICTIRTYEPGICECCGQPIERREEPARAP